LPDNNFAGLRTALEAIMREAGELARETSRRPFKRWTKGHDDSPVTEGDIAVNDLLRARLGDLLPAAAWVSEETPGAPDRTPPLAWVVDPIDGTRAYIAGRADWSISVALVENARPRLAALYAPAAEEMFLAAEGTGAALNGARIAVSGGGALTGAKLAGPKRYLEKLAALDASILPQPRVPSLALRLARVAQGELDAAFSSPGSHDWDLAAADLLVHEAGGLFTDFSGQTLTYTAPQAEHGALLAAGGARHRLLIETLRDRRGEFA